MGYYHERRWVHTLKLIYIHTCLREGYCNSWHCLRIVYTDAYTILNPTQPPPHPQNKCHFFGVNFKLRILIKLDTRYSTNVFFIFKINKDSHLLSKENCNYFSLKVDKELSFFFERGCTLIIPS